jgi:hypothetical protein
VQVEVVGNSLSSEALVRDARGEEGGDLTIRKRWTTRKWRNQRRKEGKHSEAKRRKKG